MSEQDAEDLANIRAILASGRRGRRFTRTRQMRWAMRRAVWWRRVRRVLAPRFLGR